MSNGYTTLLARCESVVADPMAYVAEWKKANPGGKAIGFLPTYVPLEPIYGAGGLPVGLWGGDVEISIADAYIQQFTCSLVRSVTEYAFTNAYDGLDAVLFPPVCDSLKLVGSIWSYNLAGKFVVEMANLPERVDSPAAVVYLAAELRRVAEKLTGEPLRDEQFQAGIAAVNRLRQAMNGFCDWRRTRNVAMAEVATILRAGTILHSDEYCSLVAEAISDGQQTVEPLRGVPVVVSGLSCQLPHPGMLRCFDEAGLRIADDDLFLGVRGSAPVSSTGNPYTSIAQAYCRSAPMAIRHAEDSQRHVRMLDQIAQSKAKGVVLMVPKFCEPEWFDLRYLREELQQRNIRHIVIDFEEGLGATGSLQTRLSAFAESIS